MSKLYEINVKLSDNQKKNLSKAYRDRETIVLRLGNNALSGSDTLYVPAQTAKKLQKHKSMNKGLDIKLSKSNIRKQVGGSLLSTITSLAMRAAPTIAKTIGLAGLAGGTSALVKKLVGKGQSGGFLIPNNKINQLIQYKNMLTTKQKQDLLNALQSGSGMKFKPTKTQLGSGWGTLLASIGIPMLLNAFTGKGAPRVGRAPRSVTVKSKGGAAPRLGRYRPPPFIGQWPNQTTHGYGKKKKASKKGKGLLLGPNSPFNKIPLIGAIL